MPFVGPISWRNNSIRPVVLLTGRVDVVAFKQRMATEPFTDLIESRLEGKPVAISTIHHRAGPWVVQSHGVLNLVSGDFSMTTGELERMLDEAEWRHLTNSGFKEFDFGTRN